MKTHHHKFLLKRAACGIRHPRRDSQNCREQKVPAPHLRPVSKPDRDKARGQPDQIGVNKPLHFLGIDQSNCAVGREDLPDPSLDLFECLAIRLV